MRNGDFYTGNPGDDIFSGDIGVEIAINIVKSLTESSNWGLGCKTYLDTLGSRQSLTVAMYRLAASPLWAAEPI